MSDDRQDAVERVAEAIVMHDANGYPLSWGTGEPVPSCDPWDDGIKQRACTIEALRAFREDIITEALARMRGAAFRDAAEAAPWHPTAPDPTERWITLTPDNEGRFRAAYGSGDTTLLDATPGRVRVWIVGVDGQPAPIVAGRSRFRRASDGAVFEAGTTVDRLRADEPTFYMLPDAANGQSHWQTTSDLLSPAWERLPDAPPAKAEQSAAIKAHPWNWCPTCEQMVDADDVHDGSEVRCIGCRKWYVVVELEGGGWALEGCAESDAKSDEEQPAPDPRDAEIDRLREQLAERQASGDAIAERLEESIGIAHALRGAEAEIARLRAEFEAHRKYHRETVIALDVRASQAEHAADQLRATIRDMGEQLAARDIEHTREAEQWQAIATHLGAPANSSPAAAVERARVVGETCQKWADEARWGHPTHTRAEDALLALFPPREPANGGAL